jgi:hypothetical protein
MEKSMAGLFQVLYGQDGGAFRKAEVLKGTDGEPLIIPTKSENERTETICTRPFAVDWDADGHLDLVVGNFSGSFYWFKGEGKGAFEPKPQLIEVGGSALKLSSAHSDPFVIDWDRDGDLDLLSGSADGQVFWSENVAGKGKAPALSSFKTLIKPGKKHKSGAVLREKDLKGPGHATRIWVDDFNGDGKLDILVGDSVHLVSPAQGLTDAEMKAKYKAWEAEFEKAQKGLGAAGEDEKANTKANEEFHKIYSRRSEFMNEEMTGFVWLFLRR